MKKWLMLGFLLVALSAYVSSNLIKGMNDPNFCSDCHAAEYINYMTPINHSDLPAHKERNITCIECHSKKGIQGNLAVKNLILNFLIFNKTYPLIDKLFGSNISLNKSFNFSGFSVLEANCTKCHEINGIKTLSINHSNSSKCENCHLLHKEYNKSERPQEGFWRNMGEGGHKNLTCGDCHGTDPTRLEELPQCTKCHKPHLKNAEWDRSICLDCHNNPHIPVKNAVFKGNLTKEMCAVCHDKIFKIITIYNSKHNQNIPSCMNCHTKHRQAPLCRDCHEHWRGGHTGSACYSCHRFLNGCTDCHTNPHAPLSGLPRISGGWEEFAKQVAVKRGYYNKTSEK